MKLPLQSQSESDTVAIAEILASRLVSGDFVALDGPLGSGKTCFVRGLARGLGIEPSEVSSPTFVICQEYDAPSGVKLAHVDAYRLAEDGDLETIGWEEMLADPLTIVAVEWPSRIETSLPIRRIHVTLTHTGEQDRAITIETVAAEDDRFSDIAQRLGGKPIAARCPICNAHVTGHDDSFPFCTERCRMVDLGKWMAESYRVSRPEDASDQSV